MRPRSAKGRNRAERAPTTTCSVPSATPRQTRSRARGATSECHSAGRVPKRRPKRSRKSAVSEISGSRIEHLPAGLHRRRDRLEIDLRLARAGDAVEERDRIAACRHHLAQMVGGGGLLGGELRRAVVRIGRQRHRPRRHHHGFQRAGLHQPLHHARADAGRRGEAALRPGRDFVLPVGSVSRRASPARAARAGGHALRRRPASRTPGTGASGSSASGARSTMRSTMPRDGQRVVGHPVDETADFRIERRHIEGAVDRPQAIVADARVRRIVPDDADDIARAERHADDVARLGSRPARDRYRARPPPPAPAPKRSIRRPRSSRISSGVDGVRADDGPGFG